MKGVATWSYATLTTLERPVELKDKPFLTAAEATAFEQKTLKIQDRDRRDVDSSTGRGSDGRTDVDRAYNQAWWEYGSKIVGTRRTSLVIDPPDGMIPALTPDGARRALDKRGLWMANGQYRRRRGWYWLRLVRRSSMQERCLGWTVAGPSMIPGAYNNNVGIVQTSDYVVFLNEMVHDHRVIPLDARPRVGEAIRLWMGSSRARWDGDTLVVSTTNFRPMVIRSASDQFTLTEKFALVDAGRLLYEFTVNDPLVGQAVDGAVPHDTDRRAASSRRGRERGRESIGPRTGRSVSISPLESRERSYPSLRLRVREGRRNRFAPALGQLQSWDRCLAARRPHERTGVARSHPVKQCPRSSPPFARARSRSLADGHQSCRRCSAHVAAS